MNERRRNYIDALELMRKAVQLEPNNPRYGFEYAHLCAQLGQTQTADRVVMTQLQNGADPRICYQRLAVNSLAQDKLEDAMLLLRECASLSGGKLSDGDAAMLFSLETVHGAGRFAPVMMRGQSGRRLTRYVRCVSRLPKLLSEGNIDAARTLLARSGGEAIGRRDHMLALEALIDALDGKDTEARRKAEKVLEKDAEGDAIGMCAQVFAEIGDEDRARTVMAQFCEKYAKTNLMAMAAKIYADIHMYPEAEACLSDFCEAPSADDDALHLYSAVLCRMSEPRERIEIGWQKSLRRDPHDSVARYWLECLGESTALSPEFVRRIPDVQKQMLQKANAGEAGFEEALFDIAHTMLKIGTDTDDAVAYLLRCRTEKCARAELSAALLRRKVSAKMRAEMEKQGLSVVKLCPPLRVLGDETVLSNAQERILVRCTRDNLWNDFKQNCAAEVLGEMQSLQKSGSLRRRMMRDENAKLVLMIRSVLHAHGDDSRDVSTLCRLYKASPRKAEHYRRLMMEGKKQ